MTEKFGEMECDVSLLDGMLDDWQEDEEDWNDTKWAEPSSAGHSETSRKKVIEDHKVCDDSNFKQETTEQNKNKNSDGVVTSMLLNDNKAGMTGLDKERINQIIHQASKGSKFYEKERVKEEQMKKRIEEQKKKIELISARQLIQGSLQADSLLEDFEQQRDLSRCIVHIDMDAFYAAVEMRDDPSLIDKPMAVGGSDMLSTSNYPARKFGVRAAMPGFIAKKLCPDLIIVSTNFDKYTSVSKEIKSVMAEYDPNFCPMSLDEAYLDLTEHLMKRQNMSIEERTVICRDSDYAFSRAYCICDLNLVAQYHNLADSSPYSDGAGVAFKIQGSNSKQTVSEPAKGSNSSKTAPETAKGSCFSKTVSEPAKGSNSSKTVSEPSKGSNSSLTVSDQVKGSNSSITISDQVKGSNSTTRTESEQVKGSYSTETVCDLKGSNCTKTQPQNFMGDNFSADTKGNNSCPDCGKLLPPYSTEIFGLTDEDAVKELRTKIQQRTRLTASAGIAPNMMLAKVCSDRNKPNGQYKIPFTRDHVISFIKDLPTRKISGIGKVSEAMLNGLGVHTCTDLYKQRGLLYHLYSTISFNYFMRICLGIGSTTVKRDNERKSMSTERTFSEINTTSELFKKLEELSLSLSEDLKMEQLKGKTISIKIKTVNFHVRTRAHTVKDYTNDYSDILQSATSLLNTEIQHSAPQPLRLRLMGVRMANLMPESLCPRKTQNTIIGAFKKLVQSKSEGEKDCAHHENNKTDTKKLEEIVENCDEQKLGIGDFENGLVETSEVESNSDEINNVTIACDDARDIETASVANSGDLNTSMYANDPNVSKVLHDNDKHDYVDTHSVSDINILTPFGSKHTKVAYKAETEEVLNVIDLSNSVIVNSDEVSGDVSKKVNSESDVHVNSESDVHVNSESEVHVNSESDVHVNSESDVHVNSESNVHVNSESDVHVNSESDVHVNSESDVHVNSESDVHVNSESDVHVNSESDVHVNSEFDVYVENDSEEVVPQVYVAMETSSREVESPESVIDECKEEVSATSRVIVHSDARGRVTRSGQAGTPVSGRRNRHRSGNKNVRYECPICGKTVVCKNLQGFNEHVDICLESGSMVKHTPDKNASDKQVSDEQMPDKQITDKHRTDKQIRDKQSTDKQITDKQSTDKQITYTQTPDKQITDKQIPVKQTSPCTSDKHTSYEERPDKDISDKRMPDKQTSGKQTSDKRMPDKQTSGKQTSDKRMPDKQTSEKQISYKQMPDKHTIDKQISDKHTIEKQFPDKHTIDKQTPDKQTIDKQTPDKQTIDKQTPDKQTIDKQTPDKQTIDKQTPDKQTIDKQTPDKQTIDKQTPDKHTIDEKTHDQQKTAKQTPDKTITDKHISPYNSSTEDIALVCYKPLASDNVNINLNTDSELRHDYIGCVNSDCDTVPGCSSRGIKGDRSVFRVLNNECDTGDKEVHSDNICDSPLVIPAPDDDSDDGGIKEARNTHDFYNVAASNNDSVDDDSDDKTDTKYTVDCRHASINDIVNDDGHMKYTRNHVDCKQVSNNDSVDGGGGGIKEARNSVDCCNKSASNNGSVDDGCDMKYTRNPVDCRPVSNNDSVNDGNSDINKVRNSVDCYNESVSNNDRVDDDNDDNIRCAERNSELENESDVAGNHSLESLEATVEHTELTHHESSAVLRQTDDHESSTISYPGGSGLSNLAEDDEDSSDEAGTLLVCPVCNMGQKSTNLHEFNEHVDVCLSRGAITELIKEQNKKDNHSLKRSRTASGNTKPAKKRKTVLPDVKSKSCRSIASFFKTK